MYLSLYNYKLLLRIARPTNYSVDIFYLIIKRLNDKTH